MNIKKQFIIDNFRISLESVDSGWTMPYSHCHAANGKVFIFRYRWRTQFQFVELEKSKFEWRRNK